MRFTGVVVLAALLPALGGCVFKPKAYPDTAVATRGTPVDIPVLDNDTDPRDRQLTVEYASGSAKGTAAVVAGQSVRYTPNFDAIGEDVFSYRIKNTRGRTSTAEVTVTIMEPAAPAATAAQLPPPAVPPSTQANPASTTVAPVLLPPAAVASAPPPTAPSANATITGIAVSLFTREDDKDAGETVQMTLRRGSETVLQRTIGGTEAWARHTDRTEEIVLNPPIAGSDSTGLVLEVRKVSSAGAGEGWVMQIDVQGRLSDGRTVSLVPKSLPFRFGGGSSNARSWAFTAVPAPSK